VNRTVIYMSTFLRSITANTPCLCFINVEVRFFFLANAILGKNVV
jgi:hypothetical protein